MLLAAGPDRFFVFRNNAWVQIQPAQALLERYEGCNIVWNGSIFASANAAGFLRTSPNGIDWTRRTLGADVKLLTWTGKQFVGLTGFLLEYGPAYFSVITHPTGLSPTSP
jgi:hypothetical protein